MTPEMVEDVARLREAFASRAHRPRDGASCLEPDWIWAALSGERPPSEVRTAVLHLAECAECAEAWRLGRELAIATGVDLAPQPATAPRERPAWRSPWVWMPAMAAVVTLAVGITLERGPFVDPADDATAWRTAPAHAIALALPDGASLSREAFVLSWEPVDDGGRYTVRVMTESLIPVATASNLLEPTYRVPESSLAKVESGTKLLWQVDAVGPGERRSSSPVAVVVVR